MWKESEATAGRKQTKEPKTKRAPQKWKNRKRARRWNETNENDPRKDNERGSKQLESSAWKHKRSGSGVRLQRGLISNQQQPAPMRIRCADSVWLHLHCRPEEGENRGKQTNTEHKTQTNTAFIVFYNWGERADFRCCASENTLGVVMFRGTYLSSQPHQRLRRVLENVTGDGNQAAVMQVIVRTPIGRQPRISTLV